MWICLWDELHVREKPNYLFVILILSNTKEHHLFLFNSKTFCTRPKHNLVGYVAKTLLAWNTDAKKEQINQRTFSRLVHSCMWITNGDSWHQRYHMYRSRVTDRPHRQICRSVFDSMQKLFSLRPICIPTNSGTCCITLFLFL